MQTREAFLRTLLTLYRQPASSGTTETEAVVRWVAYELYRYLNRMCPKMDWHLINVSVLHYGVNGQDSTRFTVQWPGEQFVLTTSVSRWSDGHHVLVIDDPQRNPDSARWNFRVLGTLRFEGTAYDEKRPLIHTNRVEFNTSTGRPDIIWPPTL